MTWKNLVGEHAITSRRRVVASALMYGLSLTVRFTSATGEETENPSQAAQRSLLSSIMIRGGASTFSRDWSAMSAQPIVFRHSPLGFQKPPCGM
jgi:hypothetical protein